MVGVVQPDFDQNDEDLQDDDQGDKDIQDVYDDDHNDEDVQDVQDDGDEDVFGDCYELWR